MFPSFVVLFLQLLFFVYVAAFQTINHGEIIITQIRPSCDSQYASWRRNEKRRTIQQNHRSLTRLLLTMMMMRIDEDYYNESNIISSKSLTRSSSSNNFQMDPSSVEAKSIICDTLSLSKQQYEQLIQLTMLVDDWNTRINLISRKDCSPNVIFGRHVLPSLAPLKLLSNNDNDKIQLKTGQRICDVGTGGGFPGLPLAIACPNLEFLLVDSVGKKISAVQDIVEKLQLQNVQTYHGRSESIIASNDDTTKFDFVIGRSVAAIPTYAFWINHLLKVGETTRREKISNAKSEIKRPSENDEQNNTTGHLIYIIGGDIDDSILRYAVEDQTIDTLLEYPDCPDKRVLIFPQPAVHQLAKMSGEKPKILPQVSTNKKMNQSHRHKNSQVSSRGEWKKRESLSATTSKQRGYENFRRYDSLEC